MIALGHPGGLEVTVIDSDQVSEANVGWQMFYPSDVGLSKATVLVNRINMAMGSRHCHHGAVPGCAPKTLATLFRLAGRTNEMRRKARLPYHVHVSCLYP